MPCSNVLSKLKSPGKSGWPGYFDPACFAPVGNGAASSPRARVLISPMVLSLITQTLSDFPESGFGQFLTNQSRF